MLGSGLWRARAEESKNTLASLTTNLLQPLILPATTGQLPAALVFRPMDAEQREWRHSAEPYSLAIRRLPASDSIGFSAELASCEDIDIDGGQMIRALAPILADPEQEREGSGSWFGKSIA